MGMAIFQLQEETGTNQQVFEQQCNSKSQGPCAYKKSIPLSKSGKGWKFCPK